jgi:hypothetical protein
LGTHGLTQTAYITPSGVTGAISALSAVGQSFPIPLAAGSPGGIVYTLNVMDATNVGAALTLHLFAVPPTSASAGSALAWTTADMANYLGGIGVSGFIGAGGWGLATVPAPGVAIFCSANRTIYGQFQARSAVTFSATANPLAMMLSTLPD